MKTLGLISMLTILDGAVLAGAADGTLPSRPVFPSAEGVAPPTRVTQVVATASLPQGTPVATAEVPKTVRRAVIADAAKRLNVAESAIVLVRAEQVTWGDGSLGCPEPGLVYTQNLVPGYLIVAKTDDRELTYHTDSREQAKNCAWVRPTAPPARSANPPADR